MEKNTYLQGNSMRLRLLVLITTLLVVVPLTAQEGIILEGFEGGEVEDIWGAGAWSFAGSTIDCTRDQPGYESDHALRITSNIGIESFALCSRGFRPPLPESTGLSFYWRADHPDAAFIIEFQIEDPTQPDPDTGGLTAFRAPVVEMAATNESKAARWARVILPWSAFTKVDYQPGGTNVFDPTKISWINLIVDRPGIGTIWIDELQLVLEPLEVAKPRDLSAVDSFLYQLQNVELDAIGQTPYDLIVMDYSREGDDETAFRRAEIEALKHSPGGEKIVLAYMSIGEAEDYRSYWKDDWEPGTPPWLDAENPDWPGNFRVRYWDPDWQAIVFGGPDSYLDKIISAGFDGVYLDLVDAYVYYEDIGRETAFHEMAMFVLELTHYAGTQNPDFLVFIQNAAEMGQRAPEVMEAVDGIGQEDLFYGLIAEGEPTPDEFLAEVEPYLTVWVSAGKTVLTIAYTTDPDQVADNDVRARNRGYIPLATTYDLDLLIPLFQPG
jgi:cysteinyl-tRNA synthetase